MTGSLPLGLNEDEVYNELVFRLHEGETLTLYTDGILEARGQRRALRLRSPWGAPGRKAVGGADR